MKIFDEEDTKDNTSKSDDNNSQPEIYQDDDGAIYVGGKRFESVEELAKGKLHADKHIDTLTGENKQLRDSTKELERLKTIEERMQKWEEQFASSNSNDGVDDGDDDDDLWEQNRDGRQPKKRQKQSSKDTNNEQTVTQEDIDKLVQQRVDNAVKELTQKQYKDQQVSKFKQKLIDHFEGDKTKAQQALQKYEEANDYDAELFEFTLYKNPNKAAKDVLDTVGGSSSTSNRNAKARPAGNTANNNKRNQLPRPAKEESLGDYWRKMKKNPNQFNDWSNFEKMNEIYDKGDRVDWPQRVPPQRS